MRLKLQLVDTSLIYFLNEETGWLYDKLGFINVVFTSGELKSFEGKTK